MSEPAVQWLLDSDEPAIRRLARRDLLHEAVGDAPTHGPRVQALLTGLDDTTLHPYKKWDGAHWRLVQLVELEATADERVPRAFERVLDWVTSIRPSNDRRTDPGPCVATGQCAARGHEAGHGGDARIQRIAHDLVQWQWPDGGWNCDRNATGRRSSFHESLIPMHGLYEYGEHAAANRTAELLLDHRLFRSQDTGEPSTRAADSATRPTGTTTSFTRSRSSPAWGQRRPAGRRRLEMLRQGASEGGNEMITLNALRVLTPSAGRSARVVVDRQHLDAREPSIECVRPHGVNPHEPRRFRHP